MHTLQKWLFLPRTYRLWRLEHWGLIGRDILNPAGQPIQDDDTHLRALIGWLCRAQDQRDIDDDAGGVSAGWSFEDGWLPSYPETSGYIVETFIAAAKLLQKPDLLERANRIIEWELSIQNKDGSFPGHFGERGSKPVIFNTGQIMHGMVEAATRLNRPECLEVSLRAGHWLIQSQDEDGCWRRNVHGGIAHTYNTRVAWAMLRTARLTGEIKLEKAAYKNLDWALKQQTRSGWFAHNSFKVDQYPYTHTIAYAIRGLLECGLLSAQHSYTDAGVKAAKAIMAIQRKEGWLAGAFGDEWEPKGGYCCLTGVAQMSVIWSRLAKLLGDAEYSEAVDRSIRFLKKNHQITGQGNPADGGLAGSLPFWGAYSRFEFPNWAAKFFADALMVEMSDSTIPSEDFL